MILVIFFLLISLQCIQCTKELFDINESLLLSPLAEMPLRTCNASIDSNGRLHCCTRQCFIAPLDITLPPVLDEYSIDCHEDAQALESCNHLTASVDIADMRNALEFESRRERRWKSKLKALKERLSPFHLKKRAFNWSKRLIASWILHKIFSAGFDLAKPLILSMLTGPMG